jgi:hypothetical protein
MAVNLAYLKATLIQWKKEEEKQNERIKKLGEQAESLSDKNYEMDCKVNQLNSLAKEKGVTFENKD